MCTNALQPQNLTFIRKPSTASKQKNEKDTDLLGFFVQLLISDQLIYFPGVFWKVGGALELSLGLIT